jgi:hypothetical protein
VKIAFLGYKINLKICNQIDQGKQREKLQIINIRCKTESIMTKAITGNILLREYYKWVYVWKVKCR